MKEKDLLKILYETKNDVGRCNGLKGCSEACMKHDVSCDFKECKNWIDFPEEYNCDLISIYKNDEMTLRDVADRLHVSFVRICQIEKKALTKFSKRLSFIKDKYLFTE